METETQRFYRRAAARTEDASIRKLLGDLAEAEAEHEHRADQLVEENLPASVRAARTRMPGASFVLRVIQPGLAGLMDGSVSTLAPLFAAAFATGTVMERVPGRPRRLDRRRHLDGLRRGAVGQRQPDRPRRAVIRGAITGLMTTLGGIGHTLPFLIPDFWTAMTVAIGVVVVELAVISWVRWKYMDTPPISAAFQVAFGGALVFATGILIGSS